MVPPSSVLLPVDECENGGHRQRKLEADEERAWAKVPKYGHAQGAVVKARVAYLRAKANGDRSARRSAKLAMRVARVALDAEITKELEDDSLF